MVQTTFEGNRVSHETLWFAVCVLEQGIVFLERFMEFERRQAEQESLYHRSSNILSYSTLGKHLRHLHLRYQIVLDFATGELSGPADFENRSKHMRERSLDIATSPRSALEAFKKSRDLLRWLDASLLEREFLIKRGTSFIKSTLDREIYAAAFHAIHHYASIRMIVVDFSKSIPDGSELLSTIPHRFGHKPRMNSRL